MADSITVATVAGIGVGIVVITDVSENKDPFKHIVAGVLFIGALSLIAMADDDVALGLAGLFTLTRFIASSDPLLKVLNSLTNQKGNNNG